MNTRRERQKGITLIEALVYIVVLVTLASALVGIMLSLRTVLERASMERRMSDAATNVFERLTRDIRDAGEVNLALSTLLATSSVLVLENGATTTTYRITNNALMVDVEGVSLGALSSDDIRVTKFSAVRYDGTGSDAVRVMLDLTTTGRYSSSTQSFSTSAVLRGSYEE